MAYVKHGTGPNDWKKGNRTKGENRTGNRKGRPGSTIPEGMLATNEAKADQVARYKEIAEQRAGVIKYGQEYAQTLWDNLNEYIEDRQAQHRPITKAGLAKASGMSYDTYLKYRKGEADHLLYEFMELHDISFDHEGEQLTLPDGQSVLLLRLSDIVKMGELALQEQLEENCYVNKGNPLGSIAGMRNYFDWQENPTGQTTHNNTLVLNNVATLSEAKESLKLLSQ